MGKSTIAECECGMTVRVYGDKTYREDMEETHSCISDAELDTWTTGANIGNRNSVSSLRPLNPEQRHLAIREAHARMNTSPGWNFSGAVGQAAIDVLRGSTPALDRSAELRDWDPTGLKSAMLARHDRR